GAFRAFIDSAESREQAVGEVTQALNAGTGSLADIEAEIVDGPYLPSRRWNAIAQIFDGGASGDRDQAARLRAAAPLMGTAQERGRLDYDDLIDKTLAMLNRTAVGWVHYKLDRGIDHVLIDEAQDTSPKQWQIVARLVDDFASGRGVRDEMLRTIFAVGDEKQSIFSFQ